VLFYLFIYYFFAFIFCLALVSVKAAVEGLSDDHSSHCGQHSTRVTETSDQFYLYNLENAVLYDFNILRKFNVIYRDVIQCCVAYCQHSGADEGSLNAVV